VKSRTRENPSSLDFLLLGSVAAIGILAYFAYKKSKLPQHEQLPPTNGTA
jgi:uncharacterized membrane protein YebE (DUF533 family)